jgi:cell division protein FtsZ
MPMQAAPEPVRAQQEAPKRSSLFSRVFGGGSAPAPAASQRAVHQEPVISQSAYRQEPAMPDFHAEAAREREPAAPARAAVRPTQIDEIGLEIPAFLRRSSS